MTSLSLLPSHRATADVEMSVSVAISSGRKDEEKDGTDDTRRIKHSPVI